MLRITDDRHAATRHFAPLFSYDHLPNGPHTLIREISGVTDLSINSEPSMFPVPPPRLVRTCRACGCSDDDCSVCIALTGQACSWVTNHLCSACVEQAEKVLRAYARNGNRATALGVIYRQARDNWRGNEPATLMIKLVATVLHEARPNASW